MNVVMLSRTLPGHGPGGLGASAWDLAQALAEAGARVRVMAPRGAAASNNANLDVQLLPAPPGRYSRAWWRESVRGFDAEAQGADVVLGVSAAANALAARRRGGRPAFVFQAHGTSAGELASRLRSPRPRALAGAVRQLYWGLARDRAYRDYDAVVAVGEAVRRQLSAWPTSQLVGRTPVHLVANGVDARAFRFDPQARGRLRASLGLADDTPLVLFAGRLQADKGPLRAFHAVRRARQARPELAFAVAGDGPERPALQAAIAHHARGPAIVWLGGLDRLELAAWLSAADALLFPTRRAEGLPLVVLEALAAGLPVITTPQGAADAELPCLRLPAQDLAGLAAAVARVDPRQPRDSRLPQSFTLAASAAAYLQLFEGLLARPARAV